MISIGNNVFEIIFPNFSMGKHEFELTLDAGTYILEKDIFVGVGKIDYNIFLFGGPSIVPYNVVIFNPLFSLSNITNVISTNSNFIGIPGTQFTYTSTGKLDVVLYVNESPKIVYPEIKLILMFKRLS